VNRKVSQREEAAHAEREAFDRALAPIYAELLQAARREVRHRLTLGQFAPDNPTPEQLLDMALQRAWRRRQRPSPPLRIKALVLASVFRTAEVLAARQEQRNKTMTELFPEEVEPDPLYQEDDEDFWQSHELDYPRTSEVFSGMVDGPREDTAEEDEFVGRLAPREREVLLMHDMHGVPLQEVALSLGISQAETERLLENARRRLRAGDNAPQ
jgi:RNA polymerase sigma factor (sigma-70 family)